MLFKLNLNVHAMGSDGIETSPVERGAIGVRLHSVTFKGDEFIDLGCVERDIDVSPMNRGELEFEISREFKPADPKVFSGG